MKIVLAATENRLADAWEAAFAGLEFVSVHRGSIFDVACDAVVSPANSFGFMDGGIDLAYSHFFGWDLQDRLQQLLRRDHAGELPVGAAVVVPTQHRAIRFLVSAPTMRVPADISETVNVYLAFRAALLAVKASKNIRSMLSPALGTGVGAMPIERAARQMYAAYAEVVLGDTEWRSSARSVLQQHARLLA